MHIALIDNDDAVLIEGEASPPNRNRSYPSTILHGGRVFRYEDRHPRNNRSTAKRTTFFIEQPAWSPFE